MANQLSAQEDVSKNILEMTKRFSAMGDLLFTRHPEVPIFDGDIFVGGFMKSGTTWLANIVYQIRAKGEDQKVQNLQDEALPFFTALCSVEQQTKVALNVNPRMFQHHLTHSQFTEFAPQAIIFESNPAAGSAKVKYIAIVRDPLDTFLSWFNFIPELVCTTEMKHPIEQMYYQFFARLTSILGYDYYSYNLEWFKHRNDENVLLLHYEDLKADLPSNLDKISEFIGCPINSAERDVIAYKCSHEYMVKHKEMFEKSNAHKLLHDLGFVNLEDSNMAVSIVREKGGKAGRAQLELPVDIKEHINRSFRNIMSPATGCASYKELIEQSHQN